MWLNAAVAPHLIRSAAVCRLMAPSTPSQPASAAKFRGKGRSRRVKSRWGDQAFEVVNSFDHPRVVGHYGFRSGLFDIR